MAPRTKVTRSAPSAVKTMSFRAEARKFRSESVSWRAAVSMASRPLSCSFGAVTKASRKASAISPMAVRVGAVLAVVPVRLGRQTGPGAAVFQRGESDADNVAGGDQEAVADVELPALHTALTGIAHPGPEVGQATRMCPARRR